MLLAGKISGFIFLQDSLWRIGYAGDVGQCVRNVVRRGPFKLHAAKIVQQGADVKSDAFERRNGQVGVTAWLAVNASAPGGAQVATSGEAVDKSGKMAVVPTQLVGNLVADNVEYVWIGTSYKCYAADIQS